MSRSYAYKPELKKRLLGYKSKNNHKVTIEDLDLELIEMSLGYSVKLHS